MNVFIDNTNVIKLHRLKSALENEFLGNATVSVTVKNLSGEEVQGQTWPQAMTSDELSPTRGNYIALLSDQLEFEPDTPYVAHVEVYGGPDLVGHWEVPFIARVRR